MIFASNLARGLLNQKVSELKPGSNLSCSCDVDLIKGFSVLGAFGSFTSTYNFDVPVCVTLQVKVLEMSVSASLLQRYLPFVKH